MPMEKLFGTDGIRGLSGLFPIDEPGSRKIGAAVGETFRRKTRSPRVVIGRDTRKHGLLFQEEFCKGLASRGATISSVGVCPTPAVVAILLESGGDAGVVVSASHNPPEYNGFKIFNSEGLKIPDNIESEITKNFENLKGDISVPTDPETAREENTDKFRTYESLLEASKSGRRDLSGVKIALDCANGAMYRIAPKVFEKTGAEVTAVGCEPNGTNINKGCGSLETALLGQTVKKCGAALGVALDGDGDRVSFCDEKGNEVDGDLIIALFALEMLKDGKLAKPRIAATVMSNKGLERFLESIGIEMVRAEVGDRQVTDIMRKETINFGGEKSGHLIFSDYSTSGDGLLSALLAADMIKKKDKPLSQILPKIEMFPQILRNVRIAEREPPDSIPGLSEAREQFERHLGKGGRIHIRYSGTEPLVRVLVEGENAHMVEETADRIAGIIERRLGGAGARRGARK